MKKKVVGFYNFRDNNILDYIIPNFVDEYKESGGEEWSNNFSVQFFSHIVSVGL